MKAGTLVAHRINSPWLVRETGWVYLKANRVPRKISEMIRVLDELLPKMGFTGSPKTRCDCRLQIAEFRRLTIG